MKKYPIQTFGELLQELSKLDEKQLESKILVRANYELLLVSARFEEGKPILEIDIR